MSTRWKDPIVAAAKPPRRHVKAEEWTKKGRKERIVELHRSGATCSEIKAAMLKEFGFDASIASYKARFKEWGLREYFSEKQRKFILKERSKRGKMPAFCYADTNQMVDNVKLERLWESRHRYGIPHDDVVSPGGLIAVASPSPYAGSTLGEIFQAPTPPLRYAIQMTPSTSNSSDSDAVMVDVPAIFEDDVEIIPRFDPGDPSLSADSPGHRLMSSLQYYDINELVLRVLKVLKIPLDYRNNGIFLKEPKCQASKFRRKGLKSITPLSPNAVEKFMRSNEISALLKEVSSILLQVKPPSYRLVEPASLKLTAEMSTESLEQSSPSIKQEPHGPSGDEGHSKSTSDKTKILKIKIPNYFQFWVNKNSWEDVEDSPNFILTDAILLLTFHERNVLMDIKNDFMKGRSLCWDEKFSKAVPLLQGAIFTYRHYFGSSSIAFLDANYYLARCLSALGLSRSRGAAEAKEILEEISKSYQNQLGLEHRRTRRSYNLLGYVLKEEGELDAALEYLKLALNGQDLEQLSGATDSPEFDNTADESVQYIAHIYDRQNQHQKAIKLEEALLNRSIQRDGYFGYYTNENRHNLARSYIKLGDFEKARKLLAQLETYYYQTFSMRGVKALWTRGRMAKCLLALDKVKEARSVSDSLHSEILAMARSKALDVKFWKPFGFLLITLGNTRAVEKDFTSALRFFEDALLLYTEKLASPSHRSVRLAITRICEVLVERGPVMYLQPLAHYLIDTQNNFNETISPSVMKWIRDRHINTRDQKELQLCMSFA